MKTTKPFIIICLCGLFLSCERVVDIQDQHEPVLQVDAVFYNGKPIPVISIKRSFNAKGRAEFYIEEDELLVRGAGVVLTHNGNPVVVEEVAPGSYQPISDQIVAMGDRFSIVVSWEGKSVSSEARVPEYPVEELEVKPGVVAQLSQVTFEHWIYEIPVQIEIPFIPVFTAVQTISETDIERCGDTCAYAQYFGENYTGWNALSLSQPLSLRILREEGEMEPPFGRMEQIPFIVTVQIPEPIYVDYIRSSSDEFVANTVTNVVGGLGLFMGAIRFETKMNVEVELMK